MIHHRTREEVRRFDLFKLIVTLVLAALLIALLLLWPSQAAPATPEPEITGGEGSEEAVEVEVEPPPRVEAPALTAPGAGTELSPGELALSGSGQPGTELEILDGGDVIGTVEVDASGGWRFPVQPEEGSHQYVVRPVGDDAAASSPVSVTVTRPPTEGRRACSAGYLTGETYVVGSCETLSEVALRTDTTVEALLAANPQVDDPDRIFAGQVLKVPQE